MTKHVAELRDVSLSYGKTQALSAINLHVRPGECLGLIGHNGSGKSSLIKTLLGFVHPQEGDVKVLGRYPDDPKGARASGLIGYIPENVAFDPGMTAHQVMAFYARLKGLPAKAGLPLLEKVGLGDAASRRVRGYSKGMRQRLGLAQALLGDAQLFLFDEPTTGLDPAARHRFYETIADLRAAGKAVLISSHALSELETRVDRIAALSAGRLLYEGSVADLRQKTDAMITLRLSIQRCQSLHLIAQLPPVAETLVPDPETLIIRCKYRDKLAVMRAVLAAGDRVRDLQTDAPTLESLYAQLEKGGRSHAQ